MSSVDKDEDEILKASNLKIIRRRKPKVLNKDIPGKSDVGENIILVTLR